MDAVRNREAVLAAAAEVFSERGLDATVPEVATRAGVGKATVYRSFPTKEHLIAAVVVDGMRWFEDQVRAGLALEDPWAGVEWVLMSAAERAAGERSLGASLAFTSTLPEVDTMRRRILDALGELMDRAKESGRMRPDADPRDLTMLLVGMGYALVARGEDDPEVWRRYATLNLDALRAEGARPLPGRPLRPV